MLATIVCAKRLLLRLLLFALPALPDQVRLLLLLLRSLCFCCCGCCCCCLMELEPPVVAGGGRWELLVLVVKLADKVRWLAALDWQRWRC